MSYLITDNATEGRPVYFDGFGFSLLRSNAKMMNVAEGVAMRSLICHSFPNCRLVAA